MQQLRQWLNACCTSHKECTSAGGFNPSIDDDEFFLPTRLVDIQSTDTGHARLCERNDIDPSSQYLTLSHCWGKEMPRKLLKATLNAMKKSILVSELSQTFQDALAMTRQLDLRYIWIDSLCIIQDSEADWRKESALMGQIYSKSHCNLAASTALDGSGGLFQDRDTFPLQPISLDVRGRICSAIPNELWSRGVEDMPLNTRAWVFQERTLARRNLHFSSTQLY